ILISSVVESFRGGAFVIDFRLPELGENITTGDELRVLVNPGDTLAKDQPVLELETDKATIEVPSSAAGKIKDVKVKAGDKVKVGQAILSVDDNGAGASGSEARAKTEAPNQDEAPTREQPATREQAPKREEAPKRNEAPKREAPKSSEAVGANTAARVPE